MNDKLCSGAGSDYMSYTKAGFPSTFAAEGNPNTGGFPGDFDPYVHTTKDTMDVDDEFGYFSIDVSRLPLPLPPPPLIFGRR